MRIRVVLSLVVLACASGLLARAVGAQDVARSRDRVVLEGTASDLQVRAVEPARLALAVPPRIALGYDLGCVLPPGGPLQCWGSNGKGQLGNGTNTDSLTPVRVTMPSGVTAHDVAVSGDTACATFSDGAVRCWGATITLTGLGGTATTPTELPGLSSVHDVVELAGGRRHMCARSSSGVVQCWGMDITGDAGGTWSDVRVVLRGARQISSGGDHACAVMMDGSMKCWGSNRSHQMGQPGNVDIENPPMRVPGLTDVDAVSAGPDYTCALRANRTVVCWGANRYCQAGKTADGCPDHGGWSASANAWLASFNEIGLSDVREISTGTTNACARMGNGNVRCWGSSHGWGIGDVNEPYGLGPAVSGIHDATSLSSNDETCAGRASGQVYCWGAGKLLYFANQTFGQAGQAFSPVRLPLLSSR